MTYSEIKINVSIFTIKLRFSITFASMIVLMHLYLGIIYQQGMDTSLKTHLSFDSALVHRPLLWYSHAKHQYTRDFVLQRFSRAGPRGRGREWATLGVHPLSWLLSNNRLEEVCSTLTKGTFSSRLLLSNQDKGCTPSVAHSLPLPLGPALLNLSTVNSTCLQWSNGSTNQHR